MKKILSYVLLLTIFFLVFADKTYAFSSASDTITTSRPSASTPLSANASSTTVLSVYDNNSIFLASDSATLWGGPAAPETVTVASQSADRTSVYLTSATGASVHTKDTVVTHAVTARHTVAFKLTQQANVNDVIRISFPGTLDNSASPSATTFTFNGLTNTNFTVNATAGTCGTLTVSASGTPYVQCVVSVLIPTTATVTFTIGSTTPALINPTKGQTIGTSDLWKLTLNHYNNSSVDVEDPTKIAIATIESVEVTGIVDASITMTIAGIANGVNVAGHNAGCNATGYNFSTNTGFASTSNGVNLGTLGTAANYSAQDITISTNGSGGYALTATSSGKLINPANGYSIANAQGTNLTANDTPVPATLPAGEAFGISACGSNASTNFDANPAKYGNPASSNGNPYVYNLASYAGAIASDMTTVVYAGKVAVTTPAGSYSTILTYIATPTF